MLLTWHRWRLNNKRKQHTNGSSLVKATKLLARFGSGLALARPLASSGGELTLHKLLANVGGAFALD